MAAIIVAAITGPMPGNDRRICPSRACSTMLTISVSSCSTCSRKSRSSLINWSCSRTRPRCRIRSLTPDAFRRQTLQFDQFCIRKGSSTPSYLLQYRKTCCRQRLGSRKPFPQGEARLAIGVLEHLHQFWKQLITDRNQLIFPPSALADEFIAVPDQSLELRSSLPLGERLAAPAAVCSGPVLPIRVGCTDGSPMSAHPVCPF